MGTMTCAVLAGISFALMGLGYKTAERKHCRSLSFTVAFSLAAVLLAALGTGVESAAWVDPRLWMLSVGIGISLLAAIAALMAANRSGPPSVSWTILNLSILVPIVPAPFLFDEPFTQLDPVILSLFILMLLAFAKGMKAEARKQEDAPKLTRAYALSLALLFLTNGLFNLGNKAKDALLGGESNGAVALIFYSTCLFIPMLTLLVRRVRPLLTRDELRVGAYTGFCSCLGTLFFLRAMAMPAAIVFPVTCGLSLLGGVTLTTLVYREAMNRWKLLGILLGTLSMLGALLR
ncbi:MAG: hypothetical protein ACYTGH_16280 [Planctomycetota bacterium]|jgi:hypothetical protein